MLRTYERVCFDRQYVRPRGVTEDIVDGHQPPRTVSRRFDFVELRPDGTAASAGPAPYLDYRPPTSEEQALVADVRSQPWLAGDPDRDEVRYLTDPFDEVHFRDLAVDSVTFRWQALWERGTGPV